MITELLLLVALSILAGILYLLIQENRTFSKLPCRWKSAPLIGNTYLSKIDQNYLGYILFENSQKLREPLLSYRQFGMYFVVINDYANYKELLVEHGAHTSGRVGFPSFSFVSKTIGERSGFFYGEGPDLVLFRRKIMSLLHTFGFSQSNFETLVVEETQRLCEKFILEKTMDPQNHLIELSAGLVSTISFNRKFSVEEPKFRKFVENLSIMMEVGMNIPISMFAPYKWIAQLPIFNQRFIRATEAFFEIFEFLQTEIFDFDENKHDFDTKNVLSETLHFVSSKGKKFNRKEIRGIFFDLYIAGMETTSSTLSWLIKLMAEFPNIQQKVFEEVSELGGVISKNRVEEIPFTNAVIHETFRFGSILTLIIPHKVTQKFTSKSGHTYPEGTILMGNLWALNRDPKMWDNPDKFDPGNFLNADGTFRDREDFIPFGAGPRSCVGKHLAKIEILIAFTTLIRQCKIEKLENEIWDISHANSKVTRRTTDYKVRFLARE